LNGNLEVVDKSILDYKREDRGYKKNNVRIIQDCGKKYSERCSTRLQLMKKYTGLYFKVARKVIYVIINKIWVIG
jgi:hypothetical protein